MVTRGQVCFRSVKVTWLDLSSFILKRRLRNHFSIESIYKNRTRNKKDRNDWNALADRSNNWNFAVDTF